MLELIEIKFNITKKIENRSLPVFQIPILTLLRQKTFISPLEATEFFQTHPNVLEKAQVQYKNIRKFHWTYVDKYDVMHSTNSNTCSTLVFFKILGQKIR